MQLPVDASAGELPAERDDLVGWGIAIVPAVEHDHLGGDIPCGTVWRGGQQVVLSMPPRLTSSPSSRQESDRR
jgi:hypothetical protein